MAQFLDSPYFAAAIFPKKRQGKCGRIRSLLDVIKIVTSVVTLLLSGKLAALKWGLNGGS